MSARNPAAKIALTSESEWYKAAYYDAPSTSYFDYPGGSSVPTTCSSPSGTANNANCNGAVGNFADVGSYTGAASPIGTYDQGGNVSEWNEATIGSFRVVRGGNFADTANVLAASLRLSDDPTLETPTTGFGSYA